MNSHVVEKFIDTDEMSYPAAVNLKREMKIEKLFYQKQSPVPSFIDQQINKDNTRIVDLDIELYQELDSDMLSFGSAVGDRRSEKAELHSQFLFHKLRNLKLESIYIPDEKIRLEHNADFSISVNTLGHSLIILFVPLLLMTVFGNVSFVHPLIGSILVIFGIGFSLMRKTNII